MVGHPKVFVHPTEAGGENSMLMTIEGKMTHLTHDVPTLKIEQISMDMQDHVVGVPPTWIRLFHKESKCVVCQREVVAKDVKALTYPQGYMHHMGL